MIIAQPRLGMHAKVGRDHIHIWQDQIPDGQGQRHRRQSLAARRNGDEAVIDARNGRFGNKDINPHRLVEPGGYAEGCAHRPRRGRVRIGKRNERVGQTRIASRRVFGNLKVAVGGDTDVREINVGFTKERDVVGSETMACVVSQRTGAQRHIGERRLRRDDDLAGLVGVARTF